MRFIKRFLRWSLGIICGLYLLLQGALHIPAVQRWAGGAVSSALRDVWHWDISVGRIQLGIWNRIIIDDITLRDEQDSLMLHASRLAAKFNVTPLLEGKISIANAQLFGTRIHLYQESPQSRPNFQFLLDTFASNDTTEGAPLNLHIGSLLLRRVDVRWDRMWKEAKNNGGGARTLDPSHLSFRNVAVTAHLRTLTSDSLNLSVKRFSFEEESGLTLQNLTFNIEAGRETGRVRNLDLRLPRSRVTIPSFDADWRVPDRETEGKPWQERVSAVGSLQMEVAPCDVKALLPPLGNARSPISLSSTLIFSEGCLNVPLLSLHTEGEEVAMNMQAFVKDVANDPEVSVNINKIQLAPTLQRYITREFTGEEGDISPVLSRMGRVELSGKATVTRSKQYCSMLLQSAPCHMTAEAEGKNFREFVARVSSKGTDLNTLLSDDGSHLLGRISFDTDIRGSLGQDMEHLEFRATTALPSFYVQEREYRDARVDVEWKNMALSTAILINAKDGSVSSHLKWERAPKGRHHLSGDIKLDNMLTEYMGLSRHYPNRRISSGVSMDLTGSGADDVCGQVNITDFTMESADGDSVFISPVSLALQTSMDDSNNKTIEIDSEPLSLLASGRFCLSSLAGSCQNLLHTQLPGIIPKRDVSGGSDSLFFDLSLRDTVLLRHLAKQDIRIPKYATAKGELRGTDFVQIDVQIPELYWKKEYLRNTLLTIRGDQKGLDLNLSGDRRQKSGFVELKLNSSAHEGRLRTIFGFDNGSTPRNKGEADITTVFNKNTTGGMDITAWVAPTDIILSDSIWNIHPANILWKDRKLQLNGIRVAQAAERGVEVNGILSDSHEDSVEVRLKHVNVEYILDLVNFNSVEFGGFATGEIRASSVLSNPKADGRLLVRGFRFNKADLGDLMAEVNWGKEPYVLGLDAVITDSLNGHHSKIQGGFNIGNKAVGNGMDLRVNTQRFNLAFINKFTEGIFDNMQGRCSGYCRIYGPFNAIDLEGDMLLNEAKFYLPMLGTSYSLQDDSVHIAPGEFVFAAQLKDSVTSRQNRTREPAAHSAEMHGSIRHRNFKDMHFDFNVDANKLLAYDRKDYGESAFVATCVVSGNVNIQGRPGRLTVNVDATPEQGTSFGYDITSPDALTESKFITFFDAGRSAVEVSPKDRDSRNDFNISSDLFLNFNLQITPDTKVRLLMNRKSGDMIELQGNGRLMAQFYNKGRFNIYGTYRVQDGVYRLSLQEIIRKDFKFQPNGTITFGGNALKADLNLKATYSVPAVSLDDLTTQSLGFSKTRVDCIMNLSGSPEHPSITFDFDLPNAGEDEKQMVRSLVSTEEERNMQAIYLLGLGRFYNTSASGADQSTAAINSLVSSTLSSGINQFISNAVSTSKWTFGTNLKTGNDGWRNMDVEGMIGGSLFDDRLLLSGNFGYREKYYTQRSFVSDVTVEYLLTSNGNISLKAYNQANDRYFVQSTLNTQGIGIQFKKDFNRFKNLFQWRSTKNK